MRTRSVGMDLVEIAANAKPPIVRIVDYKKSMDDQKKRRNPADYSGSYALNFTGR